MGSDGRRVWLDVCTCTDGCGESEGEVAAEKSHNDGGGKARHVDKTGFANVEIGV